MGCSVYAFLAEGFEEVECLAVADVLRRGGIEVKMISITSQREVTGSHQITVLADSILEQEDAGLADILFLPGGMPGTRNLRNHAGLCQALKQAFDEGRRITAICAAPSILGALGILDGKRATCYPGYEESLSNAVYTPEGVVTDGLVTTARGLGYALDLGLELVRLVQGEEKAEQIRKSIQYNRLIVG